jgi:hypothetical protein
MPNDPSKPTLTLSQRITSRFNSWYLKYLEPLTYARRYKERLAAFLPSNANPSNAELPIAQLDTRLTPTCSSQLCHQASRSFENFERHPNGSPNRAAKLLALDLRNYSNYCDYEQRLYKQSRNFHRDIKRAEEAGFFAQEFVLANHTPDILKIRRSAKRRAFGLVLEAFTLKIDDLGGAPTHITALPDQPICPTHWEKYLGVFQHRPQHKQGAIAVDQELVAYIRIRRSGNTLRYREFMGRADLISQGVMMLLQSAVVRHAIKLNQATDAAELPRIDYITYGALEHGSAGLVFWKRKALFYPHHTEIIRTALPPDFNREEYLRLNPDVAHADDEPAWHYQHHGAREGREFRKEIPPPTPK